jgi:hypothetical protein
MQSIIAVLLLIIAIQLPLLILAVASLNHRLDHKWRINITPAPWAKKLQGAPKKND